MQEHGAGEPKHVAGPTRGTDMFSEELLLSLPSAVSVPRS